MEEIKKKAREMFDEKFAPNGFISGDEELIVPDIKSFIDQIIDLAVSKERERIVEGIKSLEEMIAVKDNDSHRYQIPQSRYHEWEDFCNIPSDDEKSWDVPEWAERIDGMPVTSLKQSVINLINTK